MAFGMFGLTPVVVNVSVGYYSLITIDLVKILKNWHEWLSITEP